MNEITQVNIKELLNEKIAKVTGSNKSKAKVSIISKLQKFYYSKKYDYASNKVESLKQQNEKLNQENLDKQMEAAMLSDNAKEIVKVANKYNSKIQNTEEKIDKYTDMAAVAQSKLAEKINNDEQLETEEIVNKELSETEKILKSEVNNMQSVETPSVEKNSFDSQVEKMSLEVMKVIKPLVSEMMKEQEIKNTEEKQKYVADTQVVLNRIITGKDATIRDRESQISSLKQENTSLIADRDQYKSHLEQANNMISNKDKEIEEKNNTINSLNEELLTSKKALDAKDQEIETLRETLQKYKTSVLDIVNNIDTTSNTVEEQQSKTL